LGYKAGNVLSTLLQLGHARVADLENATKFKTADKTNLNTNHVQQNRVSDRQDLHSTLYRLIRAGYVCKVHNRSFYPIADRKNEMEDSVKRAYFPDGKISGPKARIEFAMKFNTKKEEWDREETDISAFVEKKSSGRNRPVGGTNGSDEVEYTLKGNLVLRVNFEKCAVAMRSDKLVGHVQRYFGPSTARVFEAYLYYLEERISRCEKPIDMASEGNIDDDDDTANTRKIRDQIIATTVQQVYQFVQRHPDRFDLTETQSQDTSTASSVAGDEDQHVAKKARLSTSAKPNQNTNEKLDSEYDVKQRIKNHLLLLSESGMTTYINNDQYGNFSIDLYSLGNRLKRNEVESIIHARFGPLAARIIRILRKNGKLDEKQICSMSFSRPKEVRALLDEMHAAGFAESQEIPRDNTRQPGRALYLWFFDQQRTERVVLDVSCKAMARCMQRLNVQRDRVKSVIEKAERTDVVGQEEKLLTEGDKMHLKNWREEEEKLLCQISRIDDCVAVIRDF